MQAPSGFFYQADLQRLTTARYLDSSIGKSFDDVVGRFEPAQTLKESFLLWLTAQAESSLPEVEHGLVRVSCFMYLSVKVQGLFECSKVGGCLL